MGNQSNGCLRRWGRVRVWLALLGALVLWVSGCGPGVGPDQPPLVGSVEIEVVVSGAGSVEAPEFGFSCRDTCVLAVEAGDPVTLSAVPDDAQVMVAWDGPCDALDEHCEWRAEHDARVRLQFAPHALRLALEGDGEGRFDVSDGTITTACRASCGVGFEAPRMVAITYRSEGSARTVVGPWSGACAGESRDDYCLLRVEDAVEVGTTWLHPPLARDVAYVTDQGQPLQVEAAQGVLANDEDSPGDPLRAQLLAGPAGGALTLATDGSFRYEPGAGFAGVDAFVYGVRDGYGNEAEARVRITVRPRLALSKSGAGAGRVSSEPPGIDCGSDCTSDRMHVEPGSSVTLTATPAQGSLFSGWGGACSGSGACVLSIAGPTSVSAAFALADPELGTLNVALTGDGDGRVRSEPAGIDLSSGAASAQFERDSSVTLTATPADGSRFAGWGGACSGSGVTCSLSVPESVSVTATFTRERRTLTVAAFGDGDGNVTSAPAGIDLAAGDARHDFAVGTEVTLTASATPGSSFSGWEGACSGTSPTCTLVMTEDRNVSASFERVFHTLSATIGGDGNGVVSSNPGGIDIDRADASASADFAYGTAVTLTASATPGSTFSGWSGDCSGTDCTVVMTEDRSVSATFTLDRHTLSATIEGDGAGSVSSSPSGIDIDQADASASADFAYDTEVTLTATPDEGSTFTGWSGDCSGNDCTVVMTEDRSVSATFAVIEHTLNVSTSGTGTGTGNVTSEPPGIDLAANDTSSNFDYGNEVTLTATADEGSTFSGWSGDCSGNDCTVVMTEDRTVSATFTLDRHTLSATIEGDGAGSVTSSPSGIDIDQADASASADFAYGTEVILTATPDEGSTFTGWEGDCSGTNDCTVVMTEDRTVSATFEPQPQPATVTINQSDGGTITANTPPPYTIGDNVTFTATPQDDFQHTAWTNDCSTFDANEPCNLTLNTTNTISATFEPIKHTLRAIITGDGAGSVTSNPSGIAFDQDDASANADFDHDTEVILTAKATEGSTFTGWSGDCDDTNSTNDTCTVVMTEDRNVTASFWELPLEPLTLASTGH